MPNIASILKAEITRVARKEVRAEIEALRKASIAQRSALAALKREVAELHKEIRDARKPQRVAAIHLETPPEGEVQRRFSPARLAAHRQKLGLSAAEYGSLVGLSSQSIYNYEQSKGRPPAEMVAKLSRLKELNKSEILELLKSTPQ
ncbi:helix-turn-helix domain-containing protein [Diaphorobacter ruginosibacter]|uniref:helix-turn-helix domain-containing protein n=1 Tax=Diaphorobacter ruginosibacter TaxID=1715720 RepID=UPI003341D8C1